MSITIENLEGLKRKMTIILPKEKIEPKYSERLREYAKTAKMPGFRPGKVPLKILETKVGKNLRLEVLSKLMESEFIAAINDKNLRVAGQPVVRPDETVEKDKPFQYTVIFEVYPEVELKDFEGLELSVPVAKVTEADIQKTENDIQKQHVIWNAVEKTSKKGDRVIIDFEGFVDDKPFEGNQAKEFPLELGSNQFIPGFEDQLIGCVAGEKKDVNVTFPKEYRAKELAEKSAIFKVTVHRVEEPTLPKFDDDFAKTLKIEGGLKELKETISNTMETNLSNKLWELKKTRVLKAFLEKNPITVPESLVDMEIKHLQEVAKSRFKQMQGKEWPKDKPMAREPYLEQAQRQVKLGLLLGELIKKENLTVTDEMLNQKLNDFAKGQAEPEKIKSYYKKDQRLLSQVKAVILEDEAIKKLLSSMKLKEKELSYQEVMQLSE